ncbi:MAG: decarboxylating NADP(+)-dependent phosphogluconate dehydrogenase [Chlamydiae bacterium]|nr:decarboxylating NADP(+)-dependent phosphogluconate dehydrogenase [Chlamydiota bacterium]
MDKKSNIGLIGLAVMGQNLVLNLSDHGFSVSVFNRTFEKTKEFLDGGAKGRNIFGYEKMKDFVSSLAKPRKIILLVKAGSAVTDTINEILPFLEKGDLIIDGGNSYFKDTQKRFNELEGKGVHFIGMGVSGGEEGARFGPSLMPGGTPEAYKMIEPMMTKIAAKFNNEPCVTYIGHDGAGHYTKMVHNGIEYGDIEIIAESYELLKAYGFSNQEMATVFEGYNGPKRPLKSFLIEIMGKVLRFKENGKEMIDFVNDIAGQKGTGKWTAQEALDLSVDAGVITQAVFARCLSADKPERMKASTLFKKVLDKPHHSKEEITKKLEGALYVAKIVSYTQGFILLRDAAKAYSWTFDYGKIAAIWRQGCIIRSDFLDEITKAFSLNKSLESLVMAPFFQKAIQDHLRDLREVVKEMTAMGIAAPCLSTALSFIDGYTTQKGVGTVIQALRDAFGSHQVELTTKPGEYVHINWLGSKFDVASTHYNR